MHTSTIRKTAPPPRLPKGPYVGMPIGIVRAFHVTVSRASAPLHWRKPRVVKSVTSISSWFAVVVLTVATVHPAAALDPSKTLTQYAHRIWGQEEGLFQPTIYSILQTRDGFLWLGTQDSLIRFDGMHFREFGYRGQAVLHGSLVRSLAEDLAGNLWVGTIGNGLARISPSGDFKRFGVSEGLPSANIFCLAFDRHNNLWVCTDQGLARYDGTSFHLFTTADGMPAPAVRATCEATDGTRWIAGLNFSLMRWTGKRFRSLFKSRALCRRVDRSTRLRERRKSLGWNGSGTRPHHEERLPQIHYARRASRQ